MKAAETQFIDRTDSGQQRYDRARTSRPRAALLRSAGVDATGELDLYAPPDDATARLVADFGHTTASANFLLGEYEDFTEPFRLLVDALIGIAGARTDWYEAGDWLIARHAGRSIKWVQTTRKDFAEWQKKNYVSVVDIEDHLYDPQHGNQPHKYRVHLARLAAEATLDARASREFAVHPGKALEASAKNLRTMLPSPVHKKRKRDRPDDAATQIKRRLKHMGTLMDRVDEIREATGGQVALDVYVIYVLEKRLAVLKAAAVDPDSSTYKNKVVEMRHDRRDAAPVSPALRDLSRAENPAPPIEENDAATPFAEGGGSQPEGGGNNFHPPPARASRVNDLRGIRFRVAA